MHNFVFDGNDSQRLIFYCGERIVFQQMKDNYSGMYDMQNAGFYIV